jgi:hypothetical protein
LRFGSFLKSDSSAFATGVEEGSLVLSGADLAPAFYDLTSGLAGELFQKFVNYRVPLSVTHFDVDARGNIPSITM